MKEIKVLGSGCAKCTQAAELIQAIAQDKGVAVKVVKETSLEVIMDYGVMSTPAIVIDEAVVHSGSIPDKGKIEGWLKGE